MGADSAVDRLATAGAHRLWLTSGDGLTWLTADGGNAWKVIKIGPASVGSVYFFDELHGWAAGETAYPDSKAILASTVDGGKSWQPAGTISESPEISSCRSSGFADVQFFDHEHGVAVGSGNGCANIDSQTLLAVTRDGGASWRVKLLPADNVGEGLWRVRFQSPSVVWADTSGGSVYVSHDGGDTWGLARTHTKAQFQGLAVVPGAGVFVAGGFGLVLRSRDFGQTWTEAAVPQPVADKFFVGVTFADAKRGFACGTDGVIISTTDGGETWQQEPSGRTELLRDIAVLDGEVYVAGDGPIVIKRPLEPVPSIPNQQAPEKGLRGFKSSETP
jgi:photosystem II stability/assembly factor-like uncharacterized protein